MIDLPELLSSLDPAASTPERHAWLRRWVDWVRGEQRDPATSAERVVLFLDALNARADRAEQFRVWFTRLVGDGDLTTLLADLGFAPRTALLSELTQRLKWQCLPLSPDTDDMAEVFRYLQPSLDDAQWLQHLDARTTQAWGTLWGADEAARRSLVAAWQRALLDALNYTVSQVVAAGFASEIRQRLSHQARRDGAFDQLGEALSAYRHALIRASADPSDDAQLDCAVQEQALLAQLEQCRTAASTVYAHLEQHGISVGIVFRLRQLRRRLIRARMLMDALRSAYAATPAAVPGPVLHLLVHLCQEAHVTRSIRALLRSTTGLLAERIAERSAASGEHYITRTWAEYRGMLAAASGGGAVIGLTTWAKFGLMTLALSPFWAGLAAGMNYAASFVVVMLLHFTVATKQPAVTAPAMALKLKQLQGQQELDGFVDEVAHLFRSQVAAIIGNIVAVVPVVLLISLVLQHTTSGPMVDAQKAQHVLESIDLAGPTVLLAAFTGVLLFASSLIAGSVENWFVLNRLSTAIEYQPRLRRLLGPARSAQVGQWLLANVSGLAANISLGLLLGLVPVLLQFVGVPLDVRHVTLSAGQLAASAASLGVGLLSEPAFWRAAAGVAAIGPLNLGVSFYLAFRVALASQAVTVPQRRLIRQAIWARVRRQPLSFLVPPPAAGPRH